MYNKKFDRIYLFSPSLGTIDDCPFEELPEDQKYEGKNQVFEGKGMRGVRELWLSAVQKPSACGSPQLDASHGGQEAQADGF
eukprot:COSAG02_NODE_20655_length_820_cov_1246.539528_3_plen_82_part_00